MVASATESRASFLAVLYLIALCSVGFASNVLVSLVAPILPNKFQELGIDVVWVGMVFSVFPIAILLCSPLMKVLSEKYGRVMVLSFGLLLQGLAGIVFGYCVYLPGRDPNLILGIMLLTRAIQGAGASGANLAVFAMVCDYFKDSLGTIMGLNEVVIGLGFTLGPPIGSVLESAGGFEFPFLVGGICVLGTIPVSTAIGRLERAEKKKYHSVESKMVDDEEKNAYQPLPGEPANGHVNSELTYWSLISQPAFFIPASFLFLGTTIFGVTEPIYALHCENYLGFNQLNTGYMLAWLSVAYSFFGMPAGHHADKHSCHMKVIYIGAIMSGVSMWFLGTRPASWSENYRFWSEVVLLFTLGLGQAALLIPTMAAMKNGAASIAGRVGRPKQGATGSSEADNGSSLGDVSNQEGSTVTGSSEGCTELVVALFSIFQQGGLIFGPLLGAQINVMFGFETMMILGSSFTLAYCMAVAAFWRLQK